MKKSITSTAIASCLLFIIACGGGRVRTEADAPVAAVPPGDLAPQQVPQFVCFGTDDNGYSGLEDSGANGGLHYLTVLFDARRNPAGSGNPGTFDGSPLHYSFYVNTQYLDPAGQVSSAYNPEARENPVYIKRSWREAIEHGHEIGVHTHSHFHGRNFSVRMWRREMERCIAILGRPYDAAETPDHPNQASGLGVPRDQLTGFRTPFLEYSDRTLKAARRQGFVYDCSLEEGLEADQDGRHLFWPYRLDRGSPGNPLVIGHHRGMWEIPVYSFTVPPDSECEQYGVPPGLRDKLKTVCDYFDLATGKITGMDWNLWAEYAMNPAEFLATLKYSLELRMDGNRCPLTVGLHSEMYSDKQNTQGLNASVAERRDALREFLDYVLAKSTVRVVNNRELLDWLRHPKALGPQGE